MRLVSFSIPTLLACIALPFASVAGVQPSAPATPTVLLHDDCEARGFVGVTSSVPDRDKLERLGYDQRGGAYISNVIACTGAAKAGVRPLDYLVSVNGEEVSASQEFFCLLNDVAPGTTVQVGLMRQGDFLMLPLTVGRRRDACQDEQLYPKQGFFGISGADPSRSGRNGGVRLDVSSNGPARELGLRDGDQLLRINGYPIADWSDLGTVKRLITDLDDVQFDIERDGVAQTIRGEIPKRDPSNMAFDDWDWGSWNSGSVTINGRRYDRDSMPDGSNWNRDWFDRRGLDFELDRAKAALAEIDFDQIERDVENAMSDIDWEEIADESREASRVAVEAVREAMSELRDDFGNSNRSRSRSSSRSSSFSLSVTDADAKEVFKLANDISGAAPLTLLDVEDFRLNREGREALRLSFVLPEKGRTRVNIYTMDGREIYAYDMGQHTGIFTDEVNVLRDGGDTFHLLIRQDNAAFAKTFTVMLD